MSKFTEDRLPDWQFDWMAPIYDCMSFHRDWDQLFQHLDLTPEHRLLDLGGGTAQLSDRIRQRFPGMDRNIQVLDINRSMMQQGQSKPVESGFVEGRADQLPYPDESFNRVFIGDALHHMGNQEGVLREVYRVLAPGGLLVLEEFNPATWGGWCVTVLERTLRMESVFHTPTELAKLGERTGFREDHRASGSLVYYLVLSRPVNESTM